jgi:hypothetical protein
VEDSRGIHGFGQVGESEYFFAGTEQCGGQTVVDLTSRKWANAVTDDGFIAWEYHLSPDGLLLAIGGCFWACPWQIKIFDFSQPLQVPWPEVAEVVGSGYVDPVGWAAPFQLTVKHSQVAAGKPDSFHSLDLRTLRGTLSLP